VYPRSTSFTFRNWTRVIEPFSFVHIFIGTNEQLNFWIQINLFGWVDFTQSDNLTCSHLSISLISFISSPIISSEPLAVRASVQEARREPRLVCVQKSVWRQIILAALTCFLLTKIGAQLIISCCRGEIWLSMVTQFILAASSFTVGMLIRSGRDCILKVSGLISASSFSRSLSGEPLAFLAPPTLLCRSALNCGS